jgi:hypothetical protein
VWYNLYVQQKKLLYYKKYKKEEVIMAICSSCRNIRLGDAGSGDSLIDALGAAQAVAAAMPAVSYEMLGAMIPQAKKQGVCSSCISGMSSLKNELEKHL